MGAPDGDRRPPIAVAMELASQITSVALMMALPAGAGYWLDSKVGSSPWLLMAGAAIGLTGGMIQLLRGVGRAKSKMESKDRSSDETKR